MQNIKKLLLILTFVMGMAGLYGKDENTQNLVNMAPTYKDVLVATVKNDNGENRDLRMNVFVPKTNNKKVPLLVFVHGGGWAMGDYQGDDKSNNNQVNLTGQTVNQMSTDNQSSYKIFKGILNNGIAFASIDYRLNSEAKFPAQIFDVKGAIRFLRAHADEYGIDSERIAIAGTSAGAHLATLLATTNNISELEGTVGGNLNYSSKVMACIDFYGPTDLLTMGPEMDLSLQTKEQAAETHDSIRANESILLGFNKEGQGVGLLRKLKENNDTSSPYWNYVLLATKGSPVYQVTSDDPPFFIAHGGNDSLVSIQQSLRFKEALDKMGIENIYMSNSKAPHGNQGNIVNKAALNWITNKLFK
ncbi:MAG: alpha/beta hydrolase [Fusobacteriaceae bacterium]|jgi:acetyl esterase/lipase|nr:alpha/beta hydrolase [Fusobacteriaceae bacterium]MBP6466911.1 alpha/beta hydrolase [Fusobacteriaceae bacterium]MBU9916891.1 alpha/beta hydrolase [Fusobacteriaceae bacterium]